LVWLTYACYYLGRLNLSPSLTSIADTLDISRAEVGILGTVYFWTYAFGHLVNGELGSLFSPRKLVALGLGMVALVNLAFAGQTLLIFMVILWGLNGFAQSTGWGPLSRIITENLESTQRRRISTFFSMSFQVGAAVSWGFAGLMIALGGWRLAFFVPGVLLIFVLWGWWSAGVDAPLPKEQPPSFQWSVIRSDIRTFAPILLTSTFIGVVYDGALIWLPTYFEDTGLFPDSLVGAMAGIMPIAGIFGMVLAGYLLGRLKDVLLVLVYFVGAAGLMLTCAALMNIVEIQLAFIALTMFLMGGLMSILSGTIPITLAAAGRTSSLAGTITAVTNIGGGTAGFLIGGILEKDGWNPVFALWAVCALIACGFAFGQLRMTERRTYERSTFSGD
jgi:OPA family glycerol-3-phosphate transporter-like MFS transporter